MTPEVEQLIKEIEEYVPENKEQLENFRIRYLGKKGLVKAFSAKMQQIPNEEKKAFGIALNAVKTKVEDKILQYKDSFDKKALHTDKADLSRPSGARELGSRHPISLVRNEIVEIFSRIGFTVEEGPEIEDDRHNFSALNFPEEHPARDMQDTFFIEKDPDIALRTHTSSVQVRVMENNTPPIRIIAPGRVFRNEAISARAHCVFHQIEGLYIDKGVSFADMKQTLQYFAKEFFGEARIRMRPSYFPFTEPSAEVDVYWGLKNEVDYRITKGTGWLEIMGCGMVDPNVLTNCGIDPEIYSGFAFGMGIERIAMNRYSIGDLRMYFENDKRFLKQFSSSF